MTLPRTLLLLSALTLAMIGYWCLAFGTVVLNGSSSLPHSGYFMLRAPLYTPRGSYVAFAAPDVVAAEYRGLRFVKRVVGAPGDLIRASQARVCIEANCRELLPSLAGAGFEPLPSGPIPQGKIAVFGDAENSLDSRYAAIGLIDQSDVLAVGGPIPLPNWKVIRQWLDG